jgi:hypothetical protein
MATLLLSVFLFLFWYTKYHHQDKGIIIFLEECFDIVL